MQVWYHLLLLAALVVAIRCEEHLYANGPFGKAHLSVAMPSPYNCNRSIGIFPPSTSVKITELKVSSTNYSNIDKIDVSWTPSSVPCEDDFIGVYFVEIPLATGKKMTLFEYIFFFE